MKQAKVNSYGQDPTQASPDGYQYVDCPVESQYDVWVMFDGVMRLVSEMTPEELEQFCAGVK